jgi:hypothetical protein
MYHPHHFTITWEPILSILKTEAAQSSKKLTSNCNTWCQNSEHYNLNNPHRQWGFRSSDIWCCVGGWVVPSTFMALYTFKMTRPTHPTMQCHNQSDKNALKQCVTTSNLIYMQVVCQYWLLMTELLSSILGNFIHDIHNGWTGFGEYFPPGFVNYLPSVTILSFTINLSQLLRSATDLPMQHIKLWPSSFSASIWLITW